MSDQVEPLSEREIEILRLVATGASNKEIASALVISPNTVKVHLRNIFTKIGVVSRTEATLFAIRNGIVAAPEPAGVEKAAPEAQETEGIFHSSPMALTQEELPELALPAAAAKPARPLRTYLLAAGLLLALGLLVAAGLLNWQRGPAPTQPAALVSPQPTPTSPSRWQQASSLPAARAGMGVALYNDQFYIFGGGDGAQPSAEGYKMDPANGQVAALARKPHAVEGVQAGLLGERIYLPGGQIAGQQAIDNLEVYNPRLDTWEQKKALPQPAANYALVSFEGRLYLFGGQNGVAYSSAVWIYDPQSDSWKNGSPLPSPRALLAAEVVDGKIIVMGGFDGSRALDEVLIYYPTRDGGGDSPWAPGPSLPEGRYAMSSASIANMVYLMGGKAASAAQQPWMLEPSLKKWTQIPGPGANLGLNGAARVSGNFIHVFGGMAADGASRQHWTYQAIFTISFPLTNNP